MVQTQVLLDDQTFPHAQSKNCPKVVLRTETPSKSENGLTSVISRSTNPTQNENCPILVISGSPLPLKVKMVQTQRPFKTVTPTQSDNGLKMVISWPTHYPKWKLSKISPFRTTSSESGNGSNSVFIDHLTVPSLQSENCPNSVLSGLDHLLKETIV